MSIITNIVSTITISSMLCTAYPQYLWINGGMKSENELKIVEKSITKNLNYIKEDIKMPQIKGGNDEKKITLINNTINNDILPKVEEADKISKEYFDVPGQGNPTFPYEINSKYNITTNSNYIFSLYNDYYEFLGGAHGMTIRTSYTIDKEKESLLSLKDLFILGYDYKDIINKDIKNQINKNPEIYFDSGSEFKGINENQGFYIEDDNLVIYYQLYDIAPYVAGIPEFKIPLQLFDKNFVYYKSTDTR